MARLAEIWRHPIKSHGREALDHVQLTAGRTMPYDRCWAVAHEAAKTDRANWSPCSNFSRGAKAPALMAIDASLNATAEIITLTHPDRDPLTFSPDKDPEKLIQWTNGFIPENRAQSATVVRAPKRGMTDTDYPSISLLNLASLDELGSVLGLYISAKRFRGNLWMDDLPAWEEFNWIGKTLRIENATMVVRERIERCLATTANTTTGERDADTLGALMQNWGHKDFGVYAEVTTSGEIKTGDTIEVL